MLKVSLKGLFTHKVRLVATAIAVVLGVSFLTGTQVLTASVTQSFEDLFDEAFLNVDVVVRSSSSIDTPFGGPERAPIADDLAPTVAAVAGVAAVEPRVEDVTVLLGADGQPLRQQSEPPVVAFSWLQDPELNPWRIVEGSAPQWPDDVVIDRNTADETGFAVGDTVTVGSQARQLNVVGIASFRERDSLAGTAAVLVTAPTAQALVGEPGKSDELLVRGSGDLSQEELVARVAASLPPGNEAVTADQAAAETQEGFVDAIDQIRQALLVFGYVALGVGAFIIYNTFSVIVAQRGRELALLRAVGASRTQIGLSVLLESIIVGVVAALAGVAAGVGLGAGLVRLLVALGFGLTSVPLVIETGELVTAAVLGTAVTALSALVPAWRASRVPPIAALRDISLDRPGRLVLRSAFGGALVALGALGVLRTLTTGGALELVGVYAVFVFAGMVVLGPVLAPPFVQLVGRPLPALGRISAQLARENAARSPRRTAATASALMVGIGLVTFIAVTAESIKASTVDAVDRAVQGDLIITSDGAGARALDPNLATELRALPQVTGLTTFKIGFAEVASDPQLLLAIDPSTFPELISVDLSAGSLDALGSDGVAVPSTVAEENGWRLGQTVPVDFRDTGRRFLEVVAVYDSVLPAPGDGYLISQELHAQVFPEVEQTDHTIYLQLAGGDAVDAERGTIEEVASQYPSAQVRDISQFKQDRIDRINSFLLVLYALLALALVIAVIGIVNTLLLSVYERTHELGLLRAVGMSRRQVASSICWESVLIALLGACTGVAIGLFFGWALVQALEAEGARLFSVPGGQLAGLVGLAAVAGVGAALYPAWRAARLDVLRAIATE